MKGKTKLPIGVSDFKTIRTEGYLYVDKTPFVEEILDEDAIAILITRPRRFGKTLNITTLRYFFEIGQPKDLFRGLKISSRKEAMREQGQYPVIFLSFRETRGKTWKYVAEGLKREIAREYKRHAYLLEGSTLDEDEKRAFRDIQAKRASIEEFAYSLRTLMEHLARHWGRKVIVLIDEYDVPIEAGCVYGFYEEVVSFMRTLLTGALKDNPDLAKGVLTGVFRIAKESIFSGLNNLAVYTVLSPEYSDKFGLTEDEVKWVLKQTGLVDRVGEVKAWYDGYRFGNTYPIFNPWSIICFAKRRAPQPFWVNTSSNDIIRNLVLNASSSLRSRIEKLLSGSPIPSRIIGEVALRDIEPFGETAIISLMLHAGYLTIDRAPSPPSRLFYLRIPNLEVREFFTTTVEAWLQKAGIKSEKMDELVASLLEGNISSFIEHVRWFAQTLLSYYTTSKEPEGVYQAFVLGLLASAVDSMEVESEREAGTGRCDIIISDKQRRFGIVVEFKRAEGNLEKAAEEALRQIAERGYAKALEAKGIKNIYALALSFRGKEIKGKWKKI